MLDKSDAVFADAAKVATGEPALASRAHVGRLAVGLMTGANVAGSLSALEHELATLKQTEDHAALAEAYRELAKAEAHLGRTEAADLLFEQAIVNAQLSGSGRIEADVILWQLAMQCWGYLPAGEGVRRTDGLLERGVAGTAEAFALVVRGRYRGLQRDVAGGRADIEAGRALIREFGAAFYTAGSAQEYTAFELDAGNYVGAEACAREAYDLYHAMGSFELSYTPAALLAHALVGQGRFDQAEEFTRIAEEHTAVDDVTTQMEWRSAQAQVFASKGDHTAAETLAREAVALGEQTDYLELRARTTSALAETLATSGQVEEAARWLEETIRLYALKESAFGVERATARLRELERQPLAERD